LNYSEELGFAKKLATEAGEVMLKYFLSTEIATIEKSDKTLVTKADTDINRLVIDKISEKYPTHSVWGEEQSLEIEGSFYTWVCDPVDGTVPFAKGIPVSTFSLALVDSNGKSILGVVYDPFQKRLYEATRGGGLF